MRYDEEHDRPDIDRALLRRVWSYGRPYLPGLIGILATILIISGLGVVPTDADPPARGRGASRQGRGPAHLCSDWG